jgi:hypothetical protein
MINSAASEHRRLTVSFYVTFDLENVELSGWPQVYQRQAHATVAEVMEDGGVEDLTIESMQSVGIVGQHAHVI